MLSGQNNGLTLFRKGNDQAALLKEAVSKYVRQTTLAHYMERVEPPPDPPSEDSRIARKRELADFVYAFTDDEIVIQVINMTLVDNDREIGEMLESLPI